MLATLLESASKDQNTVDPRPPQLEEIKIDDRNNFVIKPDSQPAVSFPYGNQSLLLHTTR